MWDTAVAKSISCHFYQLNLIRLPVDLLIKVQAHSTTANKHEEIKIHYNLLGRGLMIAVIFLFPRSEGAFGRGITPTCLALCFFSFNQDILAYVFPRIPKYNKHVPSVLSKDGQELVQARLKSFPSFSNPCCRLNAVNMRYTADITCELFI